MHGAKTSDKTQARPDISALFSDRLASLFAWMCRVECADAAVTFTHGRRTSLHRLRTSIRTARPPRHVSMSDVVANDVERGAIVRSFRSHSCVGTRRVDCAIDAVAFPRHRRTSPHRLCTCTRTARPQCTAEHLRQVPRNDRHREIIGSVLRHSLFRTCHVERASGVETFPSHMRKSPHHLRTTTRTAGLWVGVYTPIHHRSVSQYTPCVAVYT